LAGVAVFFAGMAIGGVLFAHESKQMRAAANNATTEISLLNAASPTVRQ
jgi:hypothetical protein